MFAYSKEIEGIKVIHAALMCLVGALICHMTVKKKLLTKK